MIGLQRTHPLDDPVASSLLGAHERFAVRNGRILRYPPDVAGFISYPSDLTDADWTDLAELVGRGVDFTLRNYGDQPPTWVDVVRRFHVVQMTGENAEFASRGGADIEVLRSADVPQMLDLVRRTRPGPFFERTIEMGTYLGIRNRGELVAMAGERLHPAGWTEISAVCVDPEFRGRGLATSLIGSVAAIIRRRGDIPFLHASAAKTNAIALYESLGFRHRARPVLSVLRIPEPVSQGAP